MTRRGAPKGVTSRQASAPSAFAEDVNSIASAVELPPVPAMMGIRPATASTVNSRIWQCSSTVTVEDSPVVPTGTIAAVPCSICHSSRPPSLAQSISPLACMGVTRATILPMIMVVAFWKSGSYYWRPNSFTSSTVPAFKSGFLQPVSILTVRFFLP